MGLITRKPVFMVPHQVRPKRACLATKTSLDSEILHRASWTFVLSRLQMTKVLIRLPICAGWYVPLLFACNSHIFLRYGPYDNMVLSYMLQYSKERLIEMVLLNIHRIYTIDPAVGLCFVNIEKDIQLNKQRSR